ncbi:hypothetical protein ABH920_001633 [Catenulispora sp. EB89]|uniref:hypothetical protein n=1 Tax=Catenulispora sp. EB89 TaxID=3156257 RepID=UPI003512E858
MNMTHATDEHPVDENASETDYETENEYENENENEYEYEKQNEYENQNRDEGDKGDGETVHHAPDEAHVERQLQDGPQGPQGRVAMAAAGIDVDRQFPVDAVDQHPDEGPDPTPEGGADNFDEAPAVDDPGGTEDPDNVAAAAPALATPPGPTSVAELLPSDDKHTFLSRWNTIQIGFVEDPAQSVRDADALIEEISAAYVNAIAERRNALSATWQSDAGTEEMRRAVLQYRSLLGVILPG